ncbi:hypothetical protein QVD17_36468 [Tagetes erecta]|uniref:Homeobox domain-containing protein n=1 Tax=Tagetes erecta TaxID=13708 RepID=A0AAD8NI88_TARER|nr:hypothetical protein QVD17_36468 [Tagetes erecta]
MEMNNLRVDSHVAQKNRRHKLRFNQISGDINNQQHQHQHQHHHQQHSHHFNPNVLPSEMIPNLLLPHPNHVFVSQDYTQDFNTVVSSQQELATATDHWNNNAVSYGYHHQDTHNFNSSPFYHNTLQQDHHHHVTLAIPPQGLSLSLSSVPHLKDDHQPMLQSGQKSDLLVNPDSKSLMGSVSGFGHRNSGPLGPFTGYATILKNSKYIKPAQELLNVSCEVGQEMGHDGYSHKILEEEMSRVDDGDSTEHVTGRNSSGGESLRPEFHRKKARLLYMLEEVCRRYKQYLQQMQMVIASFETVAGLSAATPYVCLALKTVSRHFHHVKNVISDQLSQMKKTMGEGLCSNSATVSRAFDANYATSTSGVKSGGGGFFAPQQPVWRPQRGLPERAIAVLKTWLFEHFLHPYPSDADKHMLATQTGLTRNQVSNWFINARVRIWKPMVEEIHALETKGLADQPNSSQPQSDGQDPGSWNMDMMSPLSNTQPPQCSRNLNVNIENSNVNEPLDQLRDHEKQARPEYQNNIPLSGMDRLMSIMPYPRATFDATGLGPVSLTLGLRQNAEHVQQLQQHFGGQLIHDFVG